MRSTRSESHSHAVRLREYVIAVEKADLAFRQARRSTCLICEGWSSDDTGYSLHDGRIDWAAFVPKLKSMGRAPVEAAVEAQRRHVQRIESLNYRLGPLKCGPPNYRNLLNAVFDLSNGWGGLLGSYRHHI